MSNDRYKDLALSDVDSLASFSSWLKESLKGYYMNKEIPQPDIFKYTQHLSRVISEDRQIDKPLWLSKIRNIEKQLNTRIKDEQS